MPIPVRSLHLRRPIAEVGPRTVRGPMDILNITPQTVNPPYGTMLIIHVASYHGIEILARWESVTPDGNLYMEVFETRADTTEIGHEYVAWSQAVLLGTGDRVTVGPALTESTTVSGAGLQATAVGITLHRTHPGTRAYAQISVCLYGPR